MSGTYGACRIVHSTGGRGGCVETVSVGTFCSLGLLMSPAAELDSGKKVSVLIMSVEVRDNHSEKTLHKDNGGVLLVSKARPANDVNP